MKCWKCGKNAIGICRFCGRGLCEAHFLTTVYIISTHTDVDDNLNCLAVNGALFCGKCEPIPKPVKITDIDITNASKK